jgi:hypothetical protein
LRQSERSQTEVAEIKKLARLLQFSTEILIRIGFVGLGNVDGKLSGCLLRKEVDVDAHNLDANLMVQKLPQALVMG